MTLKLAVWDIDGTIVDSRDIIQTAMHACFTQMKLPAPAYEDTRKIVGLPLYDAVKELAPEGLPETEIRALEHHYKTAFIDMRNQSGFKEPLYDGAMELIKDLSKDGWLLGVATGKSRKGLEVILEMHGLDTLVDTAWCSDDGPGKPHPHMLQQNMDQLGCFPEQTVMIGDAIFDMQMARSAKTTALGVSWGFGKEEELIEAGAHEVHHDFQTLRSSLFNFKTAVSV
jgi:phosphoglycolate phosphatase